MSADHSGLRNLLSGDAKTIEMIAGRVAAKYNTIREKGGGWMQVQGKSEKVLLL